VHGGREFQVEVAETEKVCEEKLLVTPIGLKEDLY